MDEQTYGSVARHAGLPAPTWSTEVLKGSPVRSAALSGSGVRESREMLSELLRTLLRA